MVEKKPDIKEIMADYNKAVAFFANTPAEAWEQIGVGTAMKVLTEMTAKVKVYGKFLKKHKIDPKNIKNIEDFSKLPISNKYNYIQKFGFNEVNLAQAGKNLYGLSLSSGTVDEPTIWPRYYEYEEFLPLVYNIFLRQYWQIDKKSTLIINAFSMGPWIAGFSVYQGIRPLTQKYNLTQVTTGADLESIIYTVSTIGKYYDQIIIFSYPTFARSVIDRINKIKINLHKPAFKFWIAGEGHTVKWRRYVNKLIATDKGDVTSIIDGYGISDVGLAGMGTALTNLIRDLADKDKKLCQDLFGQGEIVPNLFQYNPGSYYIEEINHELVFTTMSTTPLVRYNVKDRGGIIKFRKMEEILQNRGYNYRQLMLDKEIEKEIIYQQPFVYCFGRQSDTISVVGAIITPEQISPCLFNRDSDKIHSFKIVSSHNRSMHSTFKILLELKDGKECSVSQLTQMKKDYHSRILKHLLNVNLDFADAYRIDKQISNPKVEIYKYGQGPFESDLGRTKPRLIVKE